MAAATDENRPHFFRKIWLCGHGSAGAFSDFCFLDCLFCCNDTLGYAFKSQAEGIAAYLHFLSLSPPVPAQPIMSDNRKASARGNGYGGRVFDAARRGLGSRWEPKPKPAQQNNRKNNNGQKQQEKKKAIAPKGRNKKEAAAREAAAVLAAASVAAAVTVATGAPAAADPQRSTNNSDSAASAAYSATSSTMTNPTILKKIGNSDSPLLLSALMVQLERDNPELYCRARNIILRSFPGGPSDTCTIARMAKSNMTRSPMWDLRKAVGDDQWRSALNKVQELIKRGRVQGDICGRDPTGKRMGGSRCTLSTPVGEARTQRAHYVPKQTNHTTNGTTHQPHQQQQEQYQEQHRQHQPPQQQRQQIMIANARVPGTSIPIAQRPTPNEANRQIALQSRPVVSGPQPPQQRKLPADLRTTQGISAHHNPNNPREKDELIILSVAATQHLQHMPQQHLQQHLQQQQQRPQQATGQRQARCHHHPILHVPPPNNTSRKSDDGSIVTTNASVVSKANQSPANVNITSETRAATLAATDRIKHAEVAQGGRIQGSIQGQQDQQQQLHSAPPIHISRGSDIAQHQQRPMPAAAAHRNNPTSSRSSEGNITASTNTSVNANVNKSLEDILMDPDSDMSDDESTSKIMASTPSTTTKVVQDKKNTHNGNAQGQLEQPVRPQPNNSSRIGARGISTYPGAAPALSVAVTYSAGNSLAAAVPSAEYLEKKKKEQLLMFTRVLMKYLESKDAPMHQRAEQVIKMCAERHKAGDPEYVSLTNSIRTRLREAVGKVHWKNAEDYLKHFLLTKGAEAKRALASCPSRRGGNQPRNSQQQQPHVRRAVPTTRKDASKKRKRSSSSTTAAGAPTTQNDQASGRPPIVTPRAQKRPAKTKPSAKKRKTPEDTKNLLDSMSLEELKKFVKERELLENTIDLRSDDVEEQEPDGTGATFRNQAEQHAALVKIKVENTAQARQIMDLRGKIEEEKKRSAAGDLLALSRNA